MVLPQRIYFTPAFPSCPLSPLLPWSPLGPGAKQNAVVFVDSLYYIMKVFSDRACVLCSSFASLITLHLTKIKSVFLQCETHKILNFLSLRHDSVVLITIFHGYLWQHSLFSVVKTKPRHAKPKTSAVLQAFHQRSSIKSKCAWWSCCDVISTVKWNVYQCAPWVVHSLSKSTYTAAVY